MLNGNIHGSVSVYCFREMHMQPTYKCVYIRPKSKPQGKNYMIRFITKDYRKHRNIDGCVLIVYEIPAMPRVIFIGAVTSNQECLAKLYLSWTINYNTKQIVNNIATSHLV